MHADDAIRGGRADVCCPGPAARNQLGSSGPANCGSSPPAAHTAPLDLRGFDNALGLAARVLRYEGPALGRQVIGASWLVRDVYQEPRDHAGRTGPSRLAPRAHRLVRGTA